ncbi:Multiple RNA-binding domain-containing protein 1, partial [Spiromyces aspiralis]
MEWLRLHMGLKSDGEGSTGEGEELKDDMKQEEAQEEAPEERIRETGRLFVRNLAYTATEDDLRQHFEKFGPISEIHLPISKETKKSKGFAYVLFMMPEHAVKAYQESDGKPFQGRLMHIIPGEEKPQPSTDEQLGDMANGSDDPRLKLMSKVKKERELKKRVTATSDFNWNSLFMSADAVADAICHRLNISKTDLLESSGEEGGSKVSPAVRLALAETHIIAETKQYLEDNDVDLSVFEGLKKGTRRSDTVILVKNLHFGTMEETLRELFGRHGSLGRVLVPPSGTIGVVEFFEPSEARNAFRSLAYRRLKDAPIYLEKAPLN